MSQRKLLSEEEGGSLVAEEEIGQWVSGQGNVPSFWFRSVTESKFILLTA